MAVVVLAMAVSACGTSGEGTSSVSPSPSASPSPGTITFKLSGVNNATTLGSIALSARPGSVSIELVISGLQANSVHVSHIHIGSCQQRGIIARALNPVVADAQGNADVRSTINATYPPTNETWYVVVHAGPDMQGSNATYLLCGNLFA